MSRLVRVLAKAGEHDQAVHLARDITNPTDQAQALCRLVEALAEAGEQDRARAVAELATNSAQDITNPTDRAQALSRLVDALTRADQQRSSQMDFAIRLLAEVMATSAWVVGLDLIARCAPQQLQYAVDGAFGTW